LGAIPPRHAKRVLECIVDIVMSHPKMTEMSFGEIVKEAVCLVGYSKLKLTNLSPALVFVVFSQRNFPRRHSCQFFSSNLCSPTMRKYRRPPWLGSVSCSFAESGSMMRRVSKHRASSASLTMTYQNFRLWKH
jgi:hypothetical protein